MADSAVGLFPGNDGEPPTIADQVGKVGNRFDIAHVALVGNWVAATELDRLETLDACKRGNGAIISWKRGEIQQVMRNALDRFGTRPRTPVQTDVTAGRSSWQALFPPNFIEGFRAADEFRRTAET